MLASHLQPLADDDKLFIHELETSRDLFRLLCLSCDVTSIHPTIVPSECRPAATEDKSRFILFINREEEGGEGENRACCGVEM